MLPIVLISVLSLLLLSMANSVQGIIVTFERSKNLLLYTFYTCTHTRKWANEGGKHFAKIHGNNDSFHDFYDALMNFIVMAFNVELQAPSIALTSNSII